ncbi:MAG: DUF805 domain-containing protein [Hyphomicrobiales bacterium]
MNLSFILFDTKGRISRSQFWVGFVVLCVLAVIVSFSVFVVLAVLYIADGIAEQSKQILDPVTATLVANALLFLLFFFPSLALFVKRFHDRNQKATVLYLFYGLFLTFMFLIGDFPRREAVGGEIEEGAALLVGLGVIVYVLCGLVGLYLLIICGFLKGTKGRNQYGPDPVGPATGEQA